MSRTRTFENTNVTGQVYFFRSEYGAAWTPDRPAYVDQGNITQYDSMVDTQTQDFFRRRNLGEVFINPMTHTVRSVSVKPGRFVLVSKAKRSDGVPALALMQSSVNASVTRYWADRLGVSYPSPTIYTASPDSAFSRVRFQALSKVDKPPVALMEDLLEIRKTIKLLRHPLHEVINTSDALKRALRQKGFVRKVGSLSDTSADAWLKARFVYFNAYLSVRNLLTARKADSRPLRQTARATLDVPEINGGMTINKAQYDFSTWGYTRDRLSAGIIYEVTNPIDTFREKAGLRLKDLPPGVWAVVPLSWVVDRFVDITGALRGLRVLSDPSVKMLAGWQSRLREHEESLQLLAYHDATYVSTGIGDVYSARSKYYERSPWTPSYNDSIPTLDLGSWKHELNLAKKDVTSIIDLSALAAKKISSLAKHAR